MPYHEAKPKLSANLLFYFIFYHKIPLGVSVIFILQLAYDRRRIKWSALSCIYVSIIHLRSGVENSNSIPDTLKRVLIRRVMPSPFCRISFLIRVESAFFATFTLENPWQVLTSFSSASRNTIMFMTLFKSSSKFPF